MCHHDIYEVYIHELPNFFSQWPSLDSGNFLEHSTKTTSQMIQTGIPTIRALQVVALVASPVLRSALSHDTLHCPAASSFVENERTSLGTLFWGLGVSFQQKDIVFVHSTRFFNMFHNILKKQMERKHKASKQTGGFKNHSLNQVWGWMTTVSSSSLSLSATSATRYTCPKLAVAQNWRKYQHPSVQNLS